MICYPVSMKKSSILITLLTAFFLMSCTVSEEMVLGKENSASGTDIKVYDFFAEVLADQADLLTGSSADIVDNTMKDFTRGLANSGAATDVILIPRGRNSYTLSFGFSQFGDVIKALGGAGIEQSVIRETENSLSFYLDLDNYGDLEQAIPFLADPNFEVYGPRYNEGMSPDEYLEMMYYLLGEDAPEAISESLITIEIEVPSAIKTAEGCTRLDSRTVRYELPLLDFLLLAEPLSFSVTW